MLFEVPALPYAYDALEPYIDEETMHLHRDKHHVGYANKFSKAVEGTAWAEKSAEEILRNLDKVEENIRTAVRNNGGGYVNHLLFWQIMGPNKGGAPKGTLAEAINSTFGGFDKFKEFFQKTALERFGSGWGWLVLDGEGKLQVYSTPNQDSPLSQGHTPILAVDVWEHAYYKKYGPARAEYLTNWWNVVNWDEVESLFNKYKK